MATASPNKELCPDDCELGDAMDPMNQQSGVSQLPNSATIPKGVEIRLGISSVVFLLITIGLLTAGFFLEIRSLSVLAAVTGFFSISFAANWVFVKAQLHKENKLYAALNCTRAFLAGEDVWARSNRSENH